RPRPGCTTRAASPPRCSRSPTRSPPARSPRRRPPNARRTSYAGSTRAAPANANDSRAAARRPAMMSASEAAERAAEHVTAMTGRSAECVVGLERAGDDGWRVQVEVVETRRIPDSADILAIYETEIDADGELVGYRRARRYPRGRVERN